MICTLSKYCARGHGELFLCWFPSYSIGSITVLHQLFFILGSTNYCSQEETLAVIQPYKEGMSASMMERATQGTSRCKRLHSSTVAGPILHIAMLQEVRCRPVIDWMVICYFNILVLDGISKETDPFICISLVNAQYIGGTWYGTTVGSYACIKLKRNNLKKKS